MMSGLSTCKFPPPFRDTGMRGGGSEEAGDEVLRKSDLNYLRNTLEATVQCLFLFSLPFHPLLWSQALQVRSGQLR